MNDKGIRSFSLGALLDVCGRRPEDFYYDGCLISSHVDPEDEVPMDLFRFPVRIDAFALVFCSKGSITLQSNLTRYELGGNSLFIHVPGAILHVESMRGAEVFVAACEEEFIRRIDVDLKLVSSLALQLERYPLLHLAPGEWNVLERSIAEITDEGVPEPDDPYSREILRSSLRVLIYKACRILCRAAQPLAQIPHHAHPSDDRAYGHRVD